MLNVKKDLIGKTITGVIAVPGEIRDTDGEATCKANEIWMMQFSDGSYVEFVSPGARRGLRRSAARAHNAKKARENNPQLALNVA